MSLSVILFLEQSDKAKPAVPHLFWSMQNRPASDDGLLLSIDVNSGLVVGEDIHYSDPFKKKATRADHLCVSVFKYMGIVTIAAISETEEYGLSLLKKILAKWLQSANPSLPDHKSASMADMAIEKAKIEKKLLNQMTQVE